MGRFGTTLTAINFRYQAVLPDGASTSGMITAASQQRAIAVLQERGWFPTEVRVASAFGGKGTIPLSDLALGFRMLANLLEAGLPIGKTLATFSELAPRSWAPAIGPVRDAVRDGQTLAAALAAAPVEIPPLVIGILHAGEAGTGLGPAARRVADVMEHAASTRAAIRGVLAYPIVLAVAGSASVALMIGVVLPRFASILGDLNQQLPRTTQIVMGVTSTIRAAWIPGMIAMIVFGVLWTQWTRTARGAMQRATFLLATPFFGPLRRSAATARAAAAMASLLESGVPIATALPHAARAAGDAAIAAALTQTRDRVIRGERMSVAVRETGAMTDTAVRLIHAGEESGRLGAMLAHTATIEQARSEQTVRTAVRLVEPALILVFGGMIALVAAALLQAVYAVRAG